MDRFIARLDKFQQRHTWASFPYAVIKKFGDDSGGYQAALITYYGFLSIFPLLLVAVTCLHIWFNNNETLRDGILEGVNNYFPLLGEQLQTNVHGIQGAGVGLVIGLLITIYGARGVADAVTFMLNNVWKVPKSRRPGFPKNSINSLIMLAAAGSGFLVGVGISSFSSALDHALWVKILANIGGFVLAIATLLFIANRATARRVPAKDMLPGVTFAALIIQLLLTFGGLLVAHQLKNLDNLYGTFAIVLELLFWIYLIAQVLVYAAEIDSVRHLRLWPRAIRNDHPTDADKQAYELYAKVEKYTPNEDIDVRFKH